MTPTPSKEAVEAAARALWKMGNERIGERPWGSVCAHYIAEATVALEAARAVDAPPLSRETLSDETRKAIIQSARDYGYSMRGCDERDMAAEVARRTIFKVLRALASRPAGQQGDQG